MFATSDRGLSREVLQLEGIERAVESDSKLARTCSIGQHGLRSRLSCVRDFVEFALPIRAASPIRRSAVAGNHEFAAWGNAGINRQHVEAGDELVLRNVARGSLFQLSA